ncbi:MAG TPA: AmmeMemoRadiSam system protein A [Candidatus Eisenbacteria bacterium]|nr:AmmeMemoRadiSam system protein A [Candidatus Eisenbacteria bacterium]
MAGAEQGAILARFARGSVRAALGGPPPHVPSGEWTRERAATFVSLHWHDGRLQGCIGSLEPRRTIVEDVAANALAAAFDDPRAAGLAPADVDRLDVEVSILSPLERVSCADEAGACVVLRPHVDGVVLRWRDSRATFLPQVWAHVPDPRDFLLELKRKAGLADDLWDDEVQLFRYVVSVGCDRAARGE